VNSLVGQGVVSPGVASGPVSIGSLAVAFLRRRRRGGVKAR